jgi:hypothetical protein
VLAADLVAQAVGETFGRLELGAQAELRSSAVLQ